MSFKRYWRYCRSLQENCCSHQGYCCWWYNEIFSWNFAEVKEQQKSKKKNHATEFQGDTNHHNQQVLQADNAQAYQCELQNETVGAVWTQGIVNLFTCAVCHNLDTKTLIFRTDYKIRSFPYDCFSYILPNDKVEEEIIWSDVTKKNFFNSKISSCMY